jgi:hypothetical protein
MVNEMVGKLTNVCWDSESQVHPGASSVPVSLVAFQTVLGVMWI